MTEKPEPLREYRLPPCPECGYAPPVEVFVHEDVCEATGLDYPLRAGIDDPNGPPFPPGVEIHLVRRQTFRTCCRQERPGEYTAYHECAFNFDHDPTKPIRFMPDLVPLPIPNEWRSEDDREA